MLSEEQRQKIAWTVQMYEKGNLTAREANGGLRDVVNEASLSEVLPSVTNEDLVTRLKESVVRQPALKGVGYWRPLPKFRSTRGNQFPDPTFLVDPGWCEAEREQITSYLRMGHRYQQWRGMSYCRFECGAPVWDMGTRCLSDGEWVWPEGLAHYVECHFVRLPDEFIDSMRRKGWQMPRDIEGANREDHGLPSTSFWVNWGRNAMKAAEEGALPSKLVPPFSSDS
jgi:hypothetical protein